MSPTDIRDLVARLASDSSLAARMAADPDDFARDHQLTTDEIAMLRSLVRGTDTEGPVKLRERLSRSGMGFGGTLGALAEDVEVPAEPARPAREPRTESAASDISIEDRRQGGADIDDGTGEERVEIADSPVAERVDIEDGGTVVAHPVATPEPPPEVPVPDPPVSQPPAGPGEGEPDESVPELADRTGADPEDDLPESLLAEPSTAPDVVDATDATPAPDVTDTSHLVPGAFHGDFDSPPVDDIPAPAGPVVRTERDENGTPTDVYGDGTRVTRWPTYTETLLPDGRRAHRSHSGQLWAIEYTDGTTDQWFGDGNSHREQPGRRAVFDATGRLTETSGAWTDGDNDSHIVNTWYFADGSTRVADSASSRITYPDGSYAVDFPNGDSVRTLPDGTKIRVEGATTTTTHPYRSTQSVQRLHDGTFRIVVTDIGGTVVEDFVGRPNQPPEMPDIPVRDPSAEPLNGYAEDLHGNLILRYADGTQVVRRPAGVTSTTFPDNRIVDHYPDGTVVLTLPDGSQYNQYPDGSTISRTVSTVGTRTSVVRDRSGEVVTTLYERPTVDGWTPV